MYLPWFVTSMTHCEEFLSSFNRNSSNKSLPQLNAIVRETLNINSRDSIYAPGKKKLCNYKTWLIILKAFSQHNKSLDGWGEITKKARRWFIVGIRYGAYMSLSLFSELLHPGRNPETRSIKGYYVVGVDSENPRVKVPCPLSRLYNIDRKMIADGSKLL